MKSMMSQIYLSKVFFAMHYCGRVFAFDDIKEIVYPKIEDIYQEGDFDVELPTGEFNIEEERIP
jgi:hypothetical protein